MFVGGQVLLSLLMDPPLSPQDFPPLPTSTSPPAPTVLDRLWHNITSTPEATTSSLLISFLDTPEEIVPFNNEKIAMAAPEWYLCLVGYSLGKRPYYESLLSVEKWVWKLKGTFQLISLSDGFFLFKFSIAEDLDMVWSKGVWYLLGKPFVFQKWSPLFQLTRENFTSVPIWVKIVDLPLVCQNSEGIS